ncbi:MAG: hypothetical protein HC866_12690 [Leptolyngbyaceae cyanobacterium RU_5_1]|nr:hypothetical protein [Leptolyngbyaceae cyanobacterium RU_5_1]
MHGAVGTPSKADFDFGKQTLATCVAELSQQLKRALIEGNPLEELPPRVVSKS